MNIIEKVFGTHSERELKLIYPIVDKIESMRPEMQKLSDEELRDKTRIFKERLAKGETLDDILPEAFAVVREAAKRTLNMEHFRVQLIGGIVLHQGRIAEMRTGEGKTLVSTAPAYLNALAGKGVHIVTVNDYLAKRDAEWMGQVHRFLGLTVGVVLNDMNSEQRKAQYACDITYVTNNELGFDYLRDNMAIYKEQMVLRGLEYAIIDEVDSVLIDEARTPLIISGQSGKSTKLYEVCDILARQLERGEESGEFSKMNAILGEVIEETGDYIVNEKDKVVNLTEQGVKKVVAKSNRQNYTGIAHAAGLDSVISPKLITASHILQVVRGMQNSKGSVMNALYKICDGHAEALEFIANETTHNQGVPLKDLRLKKGILIAVLVHQGKIIIPDGSSSISAGDTVILISRNHGILDLNDIYEESMLDLGAAQ